MGPASIFILFIAMILLSFQIPGAMGIATVYGLFTGNMNMNFLFSGITRTLNSYSLLAIPMFVFAGNLMSKGSIANSLLRVCQAFGGKKKLAVGITTIVTCAFFAALSGSSVATVAAIGPITYPIMIAMGYEPAWATAIIAAGAIVGPIIPPSVIMVIYGVTAECSISDLFMGGIIPGIMLSIGFIIVLRLTNVGKIDLEKNAKAAAEIGDFTVQDKLKLLWEAKWALLMPVIVLGGIYGGIFTATEASVIACDYVLLVGFVIQRDMNLAHVWECTVSTVKSAGGLMLLLGIAQAFGYVVALYKIPDQIVQLVTGVSNSAFIILLLINGILLLTGCFMEASAAIVVLTPILLPLAKVAGLTPVQFGVIMCVNLVIGTLTPPFGLDLFVGSAVTGVPVEKIVVRAYPFILVSLVTLLLITYFPGIITFLPNLVR